VIHQRRYAAALIAIFLLGAAACTKDSPKPTETIAPSDYVAPKGPVTPSTAGTAQTVLEKTFNLKGSATFPFEIPAHSAQPHLHGIFESFAGPGRGASDDSANIDLLLLNEEQQADFDSNRPSDALFSVEASHNQAVNFDLPPSMKKPVKYYLVFRSSGGNKGGRIVDAHFRVDF